MNAVSAAIDLTEQKGGNSMNEKMLEEFRTAFGNLRAGISGLDCVSSVFKPSAEMQNQFDAVRKVAETIKLPKWGN